MRHPRDWCKLRDRPRFEGSVRPLLPKYPSGLQAKYDGTALEHVHGVSFSLTGGCRRPNQPAIGDVRMQGTPAPATRLRKERVGSSFAVTLRPTTGSRLCIASQTQRRGTAPASLRWGQLQ